MGVRHEVRAETRNTIKGHGFKIGDSFDFYGYDDIPTDRADRVVLTKEGGMYVLTVKGGKFSGEHVARVGAAKRIWAAEVVVEVFQAAEVEVDPVIDLFDRAMCLGYDEGTAMRVADCFANYNMIPRGEECPTHPNHSTSRDHQGYAVDMCEACHVIILSDEEDYFPGKWAKITAERAAEYVAIRNAQLAAAADGECVCWIISELGAANLPADGMACRGCGSVFTREGREPSGDVKATSDAAVKRNDAKSEAPLQSGVDVLAGLLSLDGGMTPAKVIKVDTGCRSLKHVYCVGPCRERNRNEANASAARTHVETEEEFLSRIAREDFRVGDAYAFRSLVGYRLYQDRPFACRGLKCQCARACHGTVVESVEILTDVAHYVSGGLEIRGDKGSRAVIRVDRLD